MAESDVLKMELKKMSTERLIVKLIKADQDQGRGKAEEEVTSLVMQSLTERWAIDLSTLIHLV